jgi:hypothetical protein
MVKTLLLALKKEADPATIAVAIALILAAVQFMWLNDWSWLSMLMTVSMTVSGYMMGDLAYRAWFGSPPVSQQSPLA